MTKKTFTEFTDRWDALQEQYDKDCKDALEEKIYYKATRMDGTDFYTGEVDYSNGKPTPELAGDVNNFPGETWYHAATTPGECQGMSWPARLFEVKPAAGAKTHTDKTHPHKIGATSLVIVRELPGYQVLGPNGEIVQDFIERCRKLTAVELDEISAWYAARDAAGYAAGNAAEISARGAAWDAAGNAAGNAARGAAWDAAWDATRDAAWDAARDAAYDATRDAALALSVKDLIAPEQFDILAEPMKEIIAEILAAHEAKTATA